MKVLIVITNSLIPGAINKVVMADVYANHQGYNRTYIIVNTNNIIETKYWWKVFYGDKSNSILVFPLFIFSWLRNKVSFRLFKHTRKWDLKLTMLFIFWRNIFSEIKVINHDFTRLLPRFGFLNKLLKINYFHVMHSMTANYKSIQMNDRLTFVFSTEFLQRHYSEKYSAIKNHPSLIKALDTFTDEEYFSKIDYNAVDTQHSVINIEKSIKQFCSQYSFNIVFYGRLIQQKGIREICKAVSELSDKSISLSIFGADSEWFNGWFADEFASHSNIRYFGGPYIDLGKILGLYDLNCLLSETESYALSVYEVIPLGIKTLVRDKPYAKQVAFNGKVIIVNDLDFHNNLPLVLQEHFNV